MTFRAFQLPCLLLLAGSALIASNAVAQEAPYQRRAKVISFTPAEKNESLYVAIMGEVASPGTYHVEPTALKLQSIVQRAGGLTAEASTTIRVIRHGRASHKEVYSDRMNSSVFPGDLLIVESKKSAPNVSNNFEPPRESTTIHASYEERSPDRGIQVALLNIADYPIVLRLRSEDANAANIVQRLGQSIELMSNTYVITPDTFPRSSSDEAKRAIRLAAGSVMVFDRERVNRSRLPSTLPKPIESDIAYGAQSGLIGSPQGQSNELRSLGGKMAGGPSETVDFTGQFRRRVDPEAAPSLPPDLRQQVSNGPADTPAPVITAKPRIANLPFTGVPRITNSSTTETSTTRAGSDSIPIPDDALDQPSSMAIAPALSLDEPQPTVAAKSFSIAQLMIIFVIVGGLSSAALLIRRVFESKAIDLQAVQQSIPENAPVAVAAPLPTAATAFESASAVEPPTAKTLLERLIKNEIPLTIEAVEFPSELALQGRIAEKPILRVDVAQNVLKQQGPHFAAKDQLASETAVQEVISQVEPAQGPSIRRPHFIDAAKAKTATTVTTSVERTEVQTEELQIRSNAPLAKALFQLEQGGRS